MEDRHALDLGLDLSKPDSGGNRHKRGDDFDFHARDYINSERFLEVIPRHAQF